ncbi:hypothetical protein [Streptosporangium amethystogenes]|uniref:hypothetical protein n=1 Tax=Streptosporangium amethystogenes TaxID=2002 RepID=UPI0004C79102|nr:hypothetical protein [Streptosporangium amethystogenes]
MSDLGTTLASGMRLLRGLPRLRAEVPQARRSAAAWAADHPELKAELVVDERPGTSVVDFHLLLQDPEGGTVALTTQADDGVPQLIGHSTHRAAGRLVSVDEIHLSAAQALTMIRSLSHRDATPHDEIVDQCLILNEIRHDDTPVGDEELQAAADEFRRRREAELGPAYLAAHPRKFDRVRALWSIGSEQRLADMAGDPMELLGAAFSGPNDEIETTIAERLAFELPEPLRDAEPGDVVGPVAHAGTFLTGVVLGRADASADERTLAAAGRVAFTEWLAERRATASIEWHRS